MGITKAAGRDDKSGSSKEEPKPAYRILTAAKEDHFEDLCNAIHKDGYVLDTWNEPTISGRSKPEIMAVFRRKDV